MRNPLITVDAGDGSSLVLYEEDGSGQLMFQHERPGAGPHGEPVPVPRYPFREADHPEPVRGRMNAYTVEVAGRGALVLAGDIKQPGIDRVLLLFHTDDPDRMALYPDWRRLCLVADSATGPTNRRTWINHPLPYYTGMPLTVRWMNGEQLLEEEQIKVGSTSTFY